MTVSESLLRAAALIEAARTAIKPYSDVKCEHCGSIPTLDKAEFKLSNSTLALVERCKELALSEFGQRKISMRQGRPVVSRNPLERPQ
jgi:hypothetical protein